MKIEKTEIKDILLITPDVFEDSRGFFFESYNKQKFINEGLEINFVQDNFSKSAKGTIRGLHYQIEPKPQGKLCQVITGKVLDVAVDIRKSSPTFGKFFAVELSSKNKMQLWIPPGFAHGFEVLEEDTIFHYKCSGTYSKEHERAILYSDPRIGINWSTSAPIVSEKDKIAATLDKQKDLFI
ncbi:MAG: dTDP-4-dehydrorhamnose 3,5-epimerase [Melioribacteraceae bacterium]